MCPDAFHRLERVLRLGPVRLDRLRMDACQGINEIHAMVDSCIDIGVVGFGAELPVGSPLVAVDNRTVPNHPLDDGYEGLCPSVQHKLHVAYFLCRGCIAEAKYPLVRTGAGARPRWYLDVWRKSDSLICTMTFRRPRDIGVVSRCVEQTSRRNWKCCCTHHTHWRETSSVSAAAFTDESCVHR